MTNPRPTVSSDIVAIDIHVHPQTAEFLAAMGARAKQMGERFKERVPISFDDLAEIYRSRNMLAVLLNSDDETQSGTPGAPNSLIGQALKDHPDTFLGFCGVDPWKGRAAVDEVRRCAEEYGIIGVGELNPARQRFHPNDPRFDELWATCAELDLPVMFHSGFPGAGAGRPGGMGYAIEAARPVPYLDDLAAHFPTLRVIAAHPGWPWHLENLAAAWHKSNYYIDLSGWAPRHLPNEVVHYANNIISNQILFGTDWPILSVDKWTDEFNRLDIKESVRPKIMLMNALTVLNLQVAT